MRLWTLTLLVLMIVLSASSSFAAGNQLQWSGGVTLMESSGGTEIGTRMEVTKNGELIACWFSKSGALPIVFDGLTVDAYGDFGGIEKIETVVLSPDSGKTQWPAQFSQGLGWRVQIPRLEPGSWSLEWGVRSKDRHNRITLIIIPINWSSHRTTQTSNYLRVQSAPVGWEAMPKEMVFVYLRGFVPAWAMPDPAAVAAQAMAGMPNAASGQLVASPIRNPAPTPAAQPSKAPKRLEKVTLILTYRGDLIEIPVTVDTSSLKKDQVIYFVRNGHRVAKAKIDNPPPYKVIEATVTAGSLLGGENVWM